MHDASQYFQNTISNEAAANLDTYDFHDRP